MFAFNVVAKAVKGWSSGVAASYFRIRATGAAWSGNLQALYEVEFYENGDATGVNSSLAATKSASDVNVNPAINAGDGNPSNYWQNNTGVNTSWWRCQFAAPKTIRSVVIKPFGLYYSIGYALEYSVDGTVWVTVKTVATSGGNGAVQRFLNIQ